MNRDSCIRAWKNQIMSELSQDDEIINALGLNPDESPDDLAWVRFFPHEWIPTTEQDVKTYILFEIQLPEERVRYGQEPSPIYSHPIIIFSVLTHQEDMKLNLAGESGTRMDYVAELISKKYNGKRGFGVGKLYLKSNVASSVNTTYRERVLVFQAVGVDNDLCEE